MATYYVALNGNDGNPGTLGAPFRHIAYGAAVLAPGDTLLVRAGQYDETITHVNNGTDWSSKCRIAAYPGSAPFEYVLLKPLNYVYSMCVLFDGDYHYIEFDGINLDATQTRDGCFGLGALSIGQGETGTNPLPHHIRLQNCDVSNGVHGFAAAVTLGTHKVGANTSPPTTILGYHEVLNVVIHGGGVPGNCGFQCSCYGIYISGPNNLVDGCEIYDTMTYAIQAYNAIPDGDGADNNVIRNCIFRDITRSGSTANDVLGCLLAGSNNAVYNNRFYRISAPGGATGIVNYYGDNNLIENNTFVDIDTGGIYIYRGDSTKVQNNIVYNVGTNYTDLGTNTIGVNSGNTNFNIPTGSTDPQFVDAPNDDYRLKPTSPCIDAGTDLSGDGFAFDAFNTPRPQGAAWDIGAFEGAPDEGGGGGGGGGSIIAFVDRGTGAGSINVVDSSVVSTPPKAVTAGHLLCVYVYADTPATQSTLVDSAGNTFTLAIRRNTPSYNVLELWYAWNCLGHPSNVVTATFDNSTFSTSIRQIEFSGIETGSDPLQDSDYDQQLSGSDLSTPSLSCPSANGSLIVAGMAVGASQSSWVPGPGYNLSSWAVTGAPEDYFADEFHIVSADEAPTATHTISSFFWVMVAASFAGAAATGGSAGTGGGASFQTGLVAGMPFSG